MRSCYFPEYWRADPRDPCPVRVRTIRLTIGKRRLMFLSVREDARDIDQDRTVTSAARQSSSRASPQRHFHLVGSSKKRGHVLLRKPNKCAVAPLSGVEDCAHRERAHLFWRITNPAPRTVCSRSCAKPLSIFGGIAGGMAPDRCRPATRVHLLLAGATDGRLGPAAWARRKAGPAASLAADPAAAGTLRDVVKEAQAAGCSRFWSVISVVVVALVARPGPPGRSLCERRAQGSTAG